MNKVLMFDSAYRLIISDNWRRNARHLTGLFEACFELTKYVQENEERSDLIKGLSHMIVDYDCISPLTKNDMHLKALYAV